MRKNTTLLLKIYELGKMNKPIFQSLTPLFEIKAYKTSIKDNIHSHNPLKRITNNPRFDYTPIKKQYDRILVISSEQESIARRNVMVNNKRNDLIHFFNNHGEKQMLYQVSLAQINQFVPNDCLLNQLQIALGTQSKTSSSNKPTQYEYIKNQSSQQNRILNFRNKALFPFNLKKWQQYLQKAFPRSKVVNRYQLTQSYFFMQINNLYMIEFAANRQLMYLDMKDFDAFLSKFNFIRFFYQIDSNNSFMAQKRSQKLIKSLKWRTQQTQQYLLMNIRSNSWERFLLIIQDFCLCYQSLYDSNKEKMQI